jgi:hypothetical protein
MPKKRIQPGEKVGLKLRESERKLILEGVMCLDGDYGETLRKTPPGKPVTMTLDEFEDFGGYIAAAANHTDDQKLQRKLDAVFQKIQRILETHTDEAESVIIKDQITRGLGLAIADALEGKPSQPISFRLPEPSKKVKAETRPLKLTKWEREAIVHGTRVRAKIRDRIKAEPEGTAVIEFTVKELDHMLEELGTAAEYVPDPYKKRLIAVVHKISDLLDPVAPARQRAPKSSDTVFQFKVTLVGTKPPIWRRVHTQDCNLGKLHGIIQAAMGWEDSHLHRFVIDGVQYGPPSPDDLDFGIEMQNETKFRLSRLFPRYDKPFRFKYEYDFGDGWLHEILFEGYRPIEKGLKYPVCLEGARACPPEDVGGVWGYAEFLEALADPKHEQHEEFVEWAGPFDPEKFDPKEATKHMKRGLPNWRTM